ERGGAGAEGVRGRGCGEGEIAGTVPYMAPEQIRGEKADTRSDLFALGVILYELVAGRRPFPGETVADVTASILRDTPLPLRTLRGEVPPQVARIIDRCLDKDPETRLRPAKDARDELERARRASEPAAPRTAGDDEPADARSDLPSIAVLPFENRSRDAEDEYFADGVTEDVIA